MARRGLNPLIALVVLVVAGGLAGALIAVAQPRQPARTPFVAPTGQAGSLPPPATGTPAPPPPASSGTRPSGSGTTRVRIDPALLAVLPATVDGLPLNEDPETEARDAGDAGHAADLQALAVAVVLDSSSRDLAIVSVVKLKPGIYSADYFRSWRDTYNEGACSRASGVAGTAESTIGEHDTFIGHCNGGLLTHHVYLTDRDVIVSISSLGDKRFGESIVEGLR